MIGQYVPIRGGITPMCNQPIRCDRTGIGIPWTPALPTRDGGYLPEHWYRSDQGLWQDAGITPAVSDGDLIGRWEDLTANADHVGQANAGNKPTLQNGAGDLLNGHPVIRGDGIDDYLNCSYVTGGQMFQPITTFIVAKLGAAAVNDNNWRHIVGSRDIAQRMEHSINAGAVPDSWQIHAGATVAGTTATSSNWIIWTTRWNGASSQFWHNGISEGSGNAGAGNPQGCTIFSRYNAGGAYWLGDIAEVLWYEADLSNGDKNQMGRYLADRYALTYTDI